MLIGAMNHPGQDPLHEIEWIATMELDFIDLTLEPPRAAPSQIDAARLRQSLRERDLGVVGHTAYYLPFASPFDELRRTALAIGQQCLELFETVGARWMNIHPDTDAPLHSKSFLIERNLQSLGDLLERARQLNIGVMVENIPGRLFNSVEDLGLLLDGHPDLGLHLDLGHCNLSPVHHNAEAILHKYAGRLKHVHLHDNKGGRDDLHLPLGAGTIDVPRLVRALKAGGYDGTITLEVFSPDRRYLDYSRNILRKLWESE